MALSPQHANPSVLTPRSPTFASLLPISFSMATLSAGGYPHPYDYDRSTPPPTPLSATLVEAPRSDERPSVPMNGPRSNSKFRDMVPTSSMPSLSTRLVGRCTPSQATGAVRHCSRIGTAPRSPRSTRTVPVRAWFSVGKRSSAKNGCRVLVLTPSTLLILIDVLFHAF